MRNIAPPQIAFPISNGYAPAEGPKCVTLKLDFTADTQSYVDLESTQSQGIIGQIQSMYVDNSANASPLSIDIKVTEQHLSVPAGADVVLQVFAAMPFQAVFTTPINAALAALKVQLLNVPLAPSIIGSTTINVGPLSGSYTDHSGTIAAGGVSQVAIPANAARKGFFLQNPPTEIETLFVDFGVAAVAGQPSIALAPGQSLPSEFSYSIQSINVLAATLGHTFVAKELL